MNDCYTKGLSVSNLRLEEIRSLYTVHSFNTANSLVVANTSGIHARADAPSGIKRITIQGGTNNTSAFSLL